MKILINDANILIDLVKLEFLEAFLKLDFDLYTTDFVIEELSDKQKLPITKLNRLKKLSIIETTSIDDFQGINRILKKVVD